MSTQEFHYTTYIRTTPENLWNAISTPEFTKQWWGEGISFDANKGSKWGYNNEKTGGCSMTGEITESQHPKRLVFTWGESKSNAKISSVTFEIEKVDDMVRLNVSHVELDADMAGRISQGWPRVLSSLKSLLESGKALNHPPKNAATCKA